MKVTKTKKQHQQPYIDNGYLYAVVFFDHAINMYDITHFKTASEARRYNEESLAGEGEVQNTRSLMYEYDCFPL